jgi:hypothetical protein
MNFVITDCDSVATPCIKCNASNKSISDSSNKAGLFWLLVRLSSFSVIFFSRSSKRDYRVASDCQLILFVAWELDWAIISLSCVNSWSYSLVSSALARFKSPNL